jgi:hypothetical protein
MAAGAAEGKGGRLVELSNRAALGHSRARMKDALPVPSVRARPHLVHFGGAAGWAAFVAFVVTLLIRNNDLPAAIDWQIVGGGMLAALAGAIGPAARWARTWIEIEPGRARCTSGVLRRYRIDVPLDRARGIDVVQSLLGRWLGYGRLQVVDEAGEAHVFPPLGNVDALRAIARRHERRPAGRATARRGDRRDG